MEKTKTIQKNEAVKPDEVIAPEQQKDRLSTLEATIVDLKRSIDQFPAVIGKVIETYDGTVNQRIELILKNQPKGGGTSGKGTLDGLIELANKFTGGEKKPSDNSEINNLANRIVILSLRKTLQNVENAMGGSSHIVVSEHQT